MQGNLHWNSMQGKLFTHLRGNYAKPETGIEWDDEHRCFLAGADQWAYLYQLNHQYVDFQHPHSADLMILWDEVMDDKQATGNRAQFSTQPPSQYVLPRIRKRRNDSNIKGKGMVSSSVINPPNFQETSNDDGRHILKNHNKRPLGSAAYSSDKEGSRGIKSRRSGSNNYQESLSNFNRFSSMVSNERATKEKYSIEIAKKIVEGLKLERRLDMYLLKELLDKEFHALFLNFNTSEQMTWIELFIVPKMEGKRGSSDNFKF